MSSLYLHPKQHEVFSDKTRFKVVAAGRRWGKCGAEGTNIKASSGMDVKIEDLKVGDSVLSVNPNTLLLEPKAVTAVASNGKKEILKVSTAFRSFRCTPNHPIMVGWDWVEARDIKPKDLIGVAKRDVFGNDKMPSYEVDFLSVWLADGDSNGYTKPDQTIIEIMNNVAKSLNIEFVDRYTENTKRIKPRTQWRWRIVDKKRKNGAIEFLKKQGVYGLTSKTKFIPDKIFKLNKEQLARFIGLFYACDGSVSIRTKDTWAIELQLANERMVRQFSSLLLKFGIRGQIRNKIHKAKSSVTEESFESWRLIISDSEMIVKFAEQIEIPSKQDKLNLAKAAALKSRGSCNTYLPISHDEFIQHLSYTPKFFDAKSIGGANAKVARDLPDDLRLSLNSWRKQTPERVSRYRFETIKEYSDGYFDKAIDGDIAWEEVISIEHDGYEETYDIEVEDNHNFVAEGLISHNSRLSQVSLIYKATEKTASSVWYIAPSYRMAKQIMWDEINRMIPTKWVKKRNETFMRIDLLNNSIIELKGADAPESLRGVGLNYVVLDEMQDMRPEVWKSVIRPTLATTRGEALFIGTSKGMDHFHDLWARGMSGTSPYWKSWQFTTESSPFVPREEIEQAKRDMDPKTYRQEFLASFEEVSGRVYHSFDKRLHVGQYRFNPNLPICIGQDFNIDPMSSVVFQPQPNGEVWVVDEIVLFSSNTQEVCEEIERRYWRNLKQITIYPDPAGGARQHARGETDLDIFREKGFTRIKYHRKHPRVADRINSVNKMLLSADGTVRLRIDEKCKHLIGSFERTMYKEGGREVDKSMSVEHSADAAGYYLEFEFPARRIETLGISI